MRNTTVQNRTNGSVLILAIVLTIIVGGLALALVQTCVAYHRSSGEALDHEMAVRAAESGVQHCVGNLNIDPDYLFGLALPADPVTLGNSSFRVEDATPGLKSDEWLIKVRGASDTSTFLIESMLGNRRVTIPAGLVVAGTGDLDRTALTLNGGSSVASYDASVGGFDIDFPGTNAGVLVNGSMTLNGQSKIGGDVRLTGELTDDGTNMVSGTLTEGTSPASVDPIDPIVRDLLASSQAANDNAVLSAIFGPQWTPATGGANYGSLVVDGGNYVIPPGTYCLERLEVRNGATVTFDTSTGPTTVTYVGPGSKQTKQNTIRVQEEAHVRISPGGTSNGVLTVLGPDTNLLIQGGSSFGRAVTPDGFHPSAGFSRFYSLGSTGPDSFINVQANSQGYGRIYAPGHYLDLGGNSTWYGSALVETASIGGSTSGPAAFVVDEALTNEIVLDRSTFQALASWPATDQT